MKNPHQLAGTLTYGAISKPVGCCSCGPYLELEECISSRESTYSEARTYMFAVLHGSVFYCLMRCKLLLSILRARTAAACRWSPVMLRTASKISNLPNSNYLVMLKSGFKIEPIL